MLTKTPGVSLYHQIKEDLIKSIKAMPDGARIPTEYVLSSTYGVSRGTVRQAVSELVADGMLHKIQGSGTYKGTARPNAAYFFSQTFTEQILASGHEPGIADVALDLVPADHHIAEIMNIEEGRLVFRLSRTRLVDGEPIAYCCAYIRAEALPNLKASDLKMSLMRMFSEKFKMEIVNRQISCKAAISTRELSKRLKVAPKSPLLYMELKGCIDNFKPLFVDISYFCDTYSLKFNPERF